MSHKLQAFHRSGPCQPVRRQRWQGALEPQAWGHGKRKAQTGLHTAGHSYGFFPTSRQAAVPRPSLGHALAQDFLGFRPEGGWLYRSLVESQSQSRPPHCRYGGRHAGGPALYRRGWPLEVGSSTPQDPPGPGAALFKSRRPEANALPLGPNRHTAGLLSAGTCLAKASGASGRFREFSC